MSCLWILEFILLLFVYTDLHKIKEQELKNNSNGTIITNVTTSNENPSSYDSINTGSKFNVRLSSDDTGISIDAHERQIGNTKPEIVYDKRKEKLTMKFFYKSKCSNIFNFTKCYDLNYHIPPFRNPCYYKFHLTLILIEILKCPCNLTLLQELRKKT